MKISNRQLAKNLSTALEEVKEKERSQVLKNFVELLYKMRKLSQADQIIEEYISYAREQKGEVNLDITTAYTLTAEMKKTIEKQFGKEVAFTETVDNSILGGIIIKTNNTIYDASIKAGIEHLKHTL